MDGWPLEIVSLGQDGDVHLGAGIGQVGVATLGLGRLRLEGLQLSGDPVAIGADLGKLLPEDRGVGRAGERPGKLVAKVGKLRGFLALDPFSLVPEGFEAVAMLEGELFGLGESLLEAFEFSGDPVAIGSNLANVVPEDRGVGRAGERPGKLVAKVGKLRGFLALDPFALVPEGFEAVAMLEGELFGLGESLLEAFEFAGELVAVSSRDLGLDDPRFELGDLRLRGVERLRVLGRQAVAVVAESFDRRLRGREFGSNAFEFVVKRADLGLDLRLMLELDRVELLLEIPERLGVLVGLRGEGRGNLAPLPRFELGLGSGLVELIPEKS